MKLVKREKMMILLGGGLTVLYLVLQFVVFPFVDQIEGMRSGIAAKEAALHEMDRLIGEYRSLRRGADAIGQKLHQRKTGFTLFSFLEEAAGLAGVKGNIKYMKPSETQGAGEYLESQVEMKLDGITLTQLVDFLRRVESPENVVTVRRISVQEANAASGYLDVTLQVLTFLQAGGGAA